MKVVRRFQSCNVATAKAQKSSKMVNTVYKMVAPFNITCAKAVTSVSAIKQGHPWLRLRTPTSLVSIALKMRGEGMGVRATSRVLDKSHSTILGRETRVAAQDGRVVTACTRRGRCNVRTR